MKTPPETAWDITVELMKAAEHYHIVVIAKLLDYVVRLFPLVWPMFECVV